MLAIASLGLVCSPAGAAQERPRAIEPVRAGPCGQRMLTTAAAVAITPNGDGVADCAAVGIRLDRPATVELVVAQRKPQPRTVAVQRVAARRGITTLVWTPAPNAAARTYVTRIAVIRAALRADGLGGERVEVASFDGLTVDFCRERGATAIVRGLRAISDFDSEMQLAHNNRVLAPEVDSVFFMTSVENGFVSSSLVKEIAQFGGDVSSMVPAAAAEALTAAFEGKYRSG